MTAAQMKINLLNRLLCIPNNEPIELGAQSRPELKHAGLDDSDQADASELKHAGLDDSDQADASEPKHAGLDDSDQAEDDDNELVIRICIPLRKSAKGTLTGSFFTTFTPSDFFMGLNQGLKLFADLEAQMKTSKDSSCPDSDAYTGPDPEPYREPCPCCG